ncbi:MAG: T9SS type A sorting domain-containing protein [Tannerella sp.]|nr:T9SS type A sorting domain-containing protein [Tannerella sp.]
MYNAYKAVATYQDVAAILTAMEDPALSTISISPNPTSGQLIIKTEGQHIQRISIYNLSGMKLFTTKSTTLDISHLPEGVYFVQITTETGSVTKKIIKK